jgi:hypothetical protein
MRPAGWVSLVLCSFLSLSQCDRSPPEPIASASAKSRTRCTVPTPAKAPPAVSAGPDPRCPEDPDGGPPKVPQGKVSFPETPKTTALDVELMTTEANRSRGLMYRRELPDNRGMLFVFDESEPRTFWMHNTCLPLDMFFIAPDGYITGLLENVPTMNDEPRGVPCKARYVLEVNAGWARKNGVKAGQTLKIEGAP